MAASESHKTLQPLSVQLSMNAHQAAPQEIKTFFKLHISRTPASEDALLKLSDPGVVRTASISPPQKLKAFAALGLAAVDSTHDHDCYNISQIPGRHKYVAV